MLAFNREILNSSKRRREKQRHIHSSCPKAKRNSQGNLYQQALSSNALLVGALLRGWGQRVISYYCNKKLNKIKSSFFFPLPRQRLGTQRSNVFTNMGTLVIENGAPAPFMIVKCRPRHALFWFCF